MAGFIFEEGTQADATAFENGDTLVFDTLAPSDITLTVTPASGLQIATITLTGGGQSLKFSQAELAGSPTLFLAAGGELIIGTDAATALAADGDDADAVYGFGGIDTITVSGDGAHLVVAGDGNDRIELLTTDAGDYTINGGDGNDNVVNTGVSTGNLYISGGLGTDTVTGGDGNDHLYGNVVAPSGTVDDGADTINAGAGSDYVNGNAGGDLINGGLGSDRLNGGAGNDTIGGGSDDGNDTVNGNKGDDSITGGDGNDSLRGGADNDIVLGGNGNDFLLGDNGDDTLTGGADADTLSGGAGEDVFVFAAGDAEITTEDDVDFYDTITDFDVDDDLINLDVGVPTDVLYVVEGTVTNNFAAGEAAAQALITAGADTDVAAVLIGTDTYLFYDSDGTGGDVDSYIVLKGITDPEDITVDLFV